MGPSDDPPPGSEEPPDEDPPPSPEEEAEALRRFNSWEADAAWRSVAYLLTGPLVYGAGGWLLDRVLGTGYLVGVGIVVGMALSLYLIWFRYGSR